MRRDGKKKQTTVIGPGMYGLPAEIAEPVIAPQQIKAMAEEIRAEHHSDRLAAADIVYVVVPGDRKAKGKTVLGAAKKLGKIDRLLSKVDFIIQLPWGAWQRMSDDQRVAVLDHELSHCGSKLKGDGTVTWVVLPHDVEEFSAVLERHGIYKGDLTEFCTVAGHAVQKAIAFEKGEAKRKKKGAEPDAGEMKQAAG